MATEQTEGLEAKMDKMLSLMAEKFGVVQQKLEEVEKVMGGVVQDVSTLKETTKELGEKVEKNERETQEQIKGMEERIKRQNERITNLEDRQRRRNIRFRNFNQDFAKGRRMTEAIREWLQSNNIEILEADIERAHWALGRRNQQQRQRDIVIAFGSENLAERIYRQLRSNPSLKQDNNTVICLRDLSQQTLRERAGLRPITACLFQHGVKFTWGFPTAILVFKGSETLRARSHEEGLQLLKRLGISMNHQQRGQYGEQQSGEREREREGEDEAEERGAVGGSELQQQQRPFSAQSGEDSSGRGTPDEGEIAAQVERDTRMRELTEELAAMKRERKRMMLRNAKRR